MSRLAILLSLFILASFAHAAKEPPIPVPASIGEIIKDLTGADFTLGFASARAYADNVIGCGGNTQGHTSVNDDEFIHFTGSYQFPTLSADDIGRYRFGLALFSDDGSSLSISDLPNSILPNTYNTVQPLPETDCSFHIVDHFFDSSQEIDMGVLYSNVYYIEYSEELDIDGCTLFVVKRPYLDIAIATHGDQADLAENQNTAQPPHEMDPGGFVLAPVETDETQAPQPSVRTRITLKAGHDQSFGGHYTLSADKELTKLRIYPTPEGSEDALTLPHTWTVEEFATAPQTYYIGSEAFKPEDQAQTGTLTFQYTPPTSTDKENPPIQDEVKVSLLPVELAVDADRNGEIEFGTDITSETTPFRFWLNNDQDDVETDEPSVVETPDHTDAQIATERDLEDFTRIRLLVGLPLDQLKNGNWKVGLRFKNSGGQSPAIRIWPNESKTGEDLYLDEHQAAERQIAKQPFGATSSGAVLIPSSYWQDRDDNEAHLIFEGMSKGTGELALILQSGSESPEIEGPMVHLKLLDVREMFQRARIANSADEIDHPWTNDTPPAQTWEWDPWKWEYDEDPEAKQTTAIFVHGWRLTYYEYLNWAQTSYKRLWHQGFKGKFYTFRWATYSADNTVFRNNEFDNYQETHSPVPPGGFTYNASEYRAWLCGPALASWVNSLPSPSIKKNIFAHSMGNVITGAALRAGMSVQRYALCNAAMASMAYDSNAYMRLDPNTGQPWDKIWGAFGPHVSPDTDTEAVIRDSFGLEGKFTSGGNHFPQMINFYLRDDEALGAWVKNNHLFKPDSEGHSYYYQHIPQPPNIEYKLFQAPPRGMPREVTSPAEAFGYVTKSLTRTAGADPRTGGSIGSSVNMDDWGVGAKHWGFGKTHSAQWRWNNQSTSHFWEQLSQKLELTK